MDAPLTPASLETAGSSTLVLIGLAAGVVEMLIGVAIGWWLRSGKKMHSDGHDNHHLRQAEHALTHLHELTHQVKADVGAHSTQVEAINSELEAHQQSGAAPDGNVLSAITKILHANQRLAEQLQTAESKLNEQAVQIKLHAAHALTDALTALGNRRAFDLELERRISEFERHGTEFSLLMLDVDHFKKFNDAHGHPAGDEVLRLVGRTLKTTLRAEDFVARYGGEEFAVIVPQTTLTEALASAERVRADVEGVHCQYAGKNLHVTVSIGLAQVVAAQSAPILVQSADQALYLAKQGGRNQVQVFKTKPAPPAALAQPTAVPTPPTVPTPTPVKSNPASVDLVHADVRTDPQTGLPNRAALCEDIRRRLAETKRHGHRVSIILLKVDNLSELLTEHGPSTEDLVLRTCTQFLAAAMRDMDLVARHDVDSFGIVLPGTALVHASCAAERLRAAIERCPLQLHDHKFSFTVSAGVAEADREEDLIGFMRRADDAKYASITRGGNRVHFHTGISVELVPNQAAIEEA